MKKITLLIVALLLTSTAAISKAKWELRKTSGSIKIYTRTDAKSNFKEFKGTAIFNQPIEAIGVAMMDIKNQKKWIKDCLKVKSIKDSGEGNGINYYVIDAPWPVSSRDMVIKNTVKFDLKKGILNIKGIAWNKGLVPLNSKYVRITRIKQSWNLKRISKNKTKVIYSSIQDPGGNLPTWVVNLKVVEMPLYTLKNLEKLASKKKYRDLAAKKYGYKE